MSPYEGLPEPLQTPLGIFPYITEMSTLNFDTRTEEDNVMIKLTLFLSFKQTNKQKSTPAFQTMLCGR